MICARAGARSVNAAELFCHLVSLGGGWAGQASAGLTGLLHLSAYV